MFVYGCPQRGVGDLFNVSSGTTGTDRSVGGFSAVSQELGICQPFCNSVDRLVGLVVRRASRAEDPGFESRLRRDFFGVESYQ